MVQQTTPLRLDHTQLAAARSDPRRPLLVLAGPGSGKTATLVERIAFLNAHEGCGPGTTGPIVALTFTRNAAHELRSRLHHRLGTDDVPRIDVRTFHSLGLQLLRDGWAERYLGLVRVRVATRGQRERALTDAWAMSGLGTARDDPLHYIAEMKRGDVDSVRYPNVGHLHAARSAYDALLRAQGLIDIEDMLALPVSILGHHAAARADLRRRIGYVVGDEGQDWSPLQAALVAYAAGPAGCVTAVGDPAQAIFGGSSPRYLAEFPSAFPAARVVPLARTYRLPPAVLAVAAAIAAHIVGAAPPRLPRRAAGPRPLLHVALSPAEETGWIADRLRMLRNEGTLCHWADAVVLARTRRQRQRLLDGLAAAGIPCRAHAVTLAEAPPIAAVVAWLSLLRDGEDGTALLGAIGAFVEARRCANRQDLCATLQASGPWTMSRLRHGCPPALTDGQKRALGLFVRVYDGLAYLAAGREPLVILDAILERTGLLAEADNSDSHVRAQIVTLRTLATEADDVGALQHLLGEEAWTDGADAVHVSTVHGFKGEEAEAVFVAGLDEGLFPHHQCLADGAAGLQRELRAFYVALTRPRALLFLSSAREPAASGQSGAPSRFLRAIPAPLVRVA